MNKALTKSRLALEFDEPRLTPTLTGLEVYGVDSIILRRSILTSSNNMVSGTDQIGDVVVENGLKIFISKKDLSRNEINNHSLAGRLCNATGIPHKHREIIANILSLHSEGHIEDYLERQNINFEKRVRAVLKIKLIDDSSGMIIPQVSTAFASKASTTTPATAPGSTAIASKSGPPSTTNDAILAQVNPPPHFRALPAKEMAEPACSQARRNAPKAIRDAISEEHSQTENMQRELQSVVNSNNRLQLEPPNPTRTEAPVAYAAAPPQVPSFNHIQTMMEGPYKRAKKPIQMHTVSEPSSGQRSFGLARNATAIPDEQIHHLSSGSDDVSPSSSPPFLTPQPSRSTLASRGGSTTPDTSVVSDTEVVRIGEQGEWVVSLPSPNSVVCSIRCRALCAAHKSYT